MAELLNTKHSVVTRLPTGINSSTGSGIPGPWSALGLLSPHPIKGERRRAPSNVKLGPRQEPRPVCLSLLP
ncbi:MAG: hypothetical protein ABI972_26665 [Acidobacteriota bacterium]